MLIKDRQGGLAAQFQGAQAVQTMINKTLNPISITSPEVNAEWVTATAEKALAAVEEIVGPGGAGMSAPKHTATSGLLKSRPGGSSSVSAASR